jgi:alpha-tubulin suppressor-like RCC1 family protein
VQVSDGNCTKQAALSALCTQLDGSDAGAQDSGVVVDSGVVDSGVVDSGVPPITGKINAIAAGNNHTCGVLASGGVKCWGSDATGQLGNGGGTSSIQATPVNVVGLLRPVTSLAAGLGEGHSCALLDDGAVECWGRNNRGQLGNGSSIDSTGPVQVSGLAGRVVSLAVGQAHSCALLETGAVQCWGWDNMGQLGNGPPLANNTLPQSVVGLTGRATSLAAGVTHTCATIEDGSVQCWGSNSVGQVNGMLTADAPSPIPVTGLAGPARDVSAGALHSCAVLNDNRVQCWGRDEAGQVGNDSPLQEAPVPPSFVVGLNQADPIVRIDSGDRHTCVVLQSGGLKCWGFDASGQIGNANVGDGTTPQDRRVQPSAVDVFGLSSGVVSVGGGTAHTCAILSSGAAKCWGRDDSGQLGNNAASPNLSGDRTTPVDVLDFP